MDQIAISAVPAQQVSAVLGGQNVQLYIYQKSQGLFMDVNSNGVDISTGTLCRNGIPTCPIAYTGFLGNFIFIDTQGTSDPTYTGLGARFQLVYLTSTEYALISQEVE